MHVWEIVNMAGSGKFVAYLPCRERSNSLGLEAQREYLSRFVAGSSGKLVREFVEVEAGKRDDTGRPQLADPSREAFQQAA